MRVDLEKIIREYDKIGGKKLFKKSLKDLNSNKKVFLFYSKKKNLPLSSIPQISTILSSKASFISFCYNFYDFYENKIEISEKNLRLIAKFVMAHEFGHILDSDIKKTKDEFSKILYKIIDSSLKYDFNISKLGKNIPYELEQLSLELKKNLIKREVKAWYIANELVDFNNDYEILLFSKLKEYALATYNYINFKSIASQYNLDTIVKFKKQLA